MKIRLILTLLLSTCCSVLALAETKRDKDDNLSKRKETTLTEKSMDENLEQESEVSKINNVLLQEDEDFILFEDEATMDVIDYILGDTKNPNIDMSFIRSKDQNDKRPLIDPELDPNYAPRTEADKMPIFSGGERKMHDFIRDNLEFPEDAKVLGIQGKVIVRFVVMPNGNTREIEVIHSLETSCDKEAMRLVEAMPRWIPGEHNGQNVAVYFTLPISFFF